MVKSSANSDSKPAAGAAKPGAGKPAAAKPARPAPATPKAAKPDAAKPEAKASGKAPQPEAVPAPPATVRRAARLMFYGAMATLAWGIFGLVVDAVWSGTTLTTGTQRISAVQVKSALLLITALETILFTVVWLWMSKMNKEGRNWARIASSVLFLGWSYATYEAIGNLTDWVAVVSLVLALVIWGFGVAAVYYIWQPQSTAYYKESPSRR